MPDIWHGSPVNLKNLLTLSRILASIIHSSMQATAYQPHQLHYHSSHYTVCLILNICVIFVKAYFINSYLSFKKK